MRALRSVTVDRIRSQHNFIAEGLKNIVHIATAYRYRIVEYLSLCVNVCDSVLFCATTCYIFRSHLTPLVSHRAHVQYVRTFVLQM